MARTAVRTNVPLVVPSAWRGRKMKTPCSYTLNYCCTLLVSAEPRQSMTALEVKFSLAISSKLDHCRV